MSGWERRLAWGDTISYSAAISACEKEQERQLALGLLSTMAIARVEANTISYSAAIGGQKGQELATRIGLAQHDGKSQSPEDTISHSAAISACEKGQNGSSQWACAARS